MPRLRNNALVRVFRARQTERQHCFSPARPSDVSCASWFRPAPGTSRYPARFAPVYCFGSRYKPRRLCRYGPFYRLLDRAFVPCFAAGSARVAWYTKNKFHNEPNRRAARNNAPIRCFFAKGIVSGMAELRAFSALRYNPNEDLASVTCPPYDVLSPQERQALADKSPHATVRVILPEGEGDAKYEIAARLMSDWQANSVLQTDDTPGLYVTRTNFSEPGSGQRKGRLGLVALLKLSEYADGHVLPHEKTLTAPKADRLKLLRATRASVESIMGLVDDETGELYRLLEQAASQTPIASYDGDDDQSHALYKIEDAETIDKIRALALPQPVFIADGHHRYETALAYARETGTLGTDVPEAFLLATITPHSDPGLVVLPTHRLVKNTPPDLLHGLLRGLERDFDVVEISRDDLEGRLRLQVENQIVFGLLLPSGTFYRVASRDAAPLYGKLPSDVSPALRLSEPLLLLHLILGPLLGLDAASIATTDRLAYTRDIDEAVLKVRDTNEYDVCFLLPNPPVTCVRDVSLEGGVMPQKSTFFYPKLASGLLMRTFEK